MNNAFISTSGYVVLKTPVKGGQDESVGSARAAESGDLSLFPRTFR